MRPSSISLPSVSFAISRRMPSNDEMTTACGVSSRGVVRGHALERVGDEVARPALRLAARLFLGLADAARELVPDKLLGALQEMRLRFVDGHSRDLLELLELRLACGFQLVLKLLGMRLSVGEALLPA